MRPSRSIVQTYSGMFSTRVRQRASDAPSAAVRSSPRRPPRPPRPFPDAALQLDVEVARFLLGRLQVGHVEEDAVDEARRARDVRQEARLVVEPAGAAGAGGEPGLLRRRGG